MSAKLVGKLAHIKEASENLWAKGTPMHPGFTLHGPQHSYQIESIVSRLLAFEHPEQHKSALIGEQELFMLFAGVWLHDVGMIVPATDEERLMASRGGMEIADWIRTHHNIRSCDYVKRMAAELWLDPLEAETIGEICRAHRGEDLRFDGRLRDHSPDSRFLAAVLRISDELDISNARAPENLLKAIWRDLDETGRWHWVKHWCARNPEHLHIRVLDEDSHLLRLTFKFDVFLPEPEYALPFWDRVISPIQRVLVHEGVDSVLLRKGLVIWLDRFEYYTHSCGSNGGFVEELERCLASQLIEGKIRGLNGAAIAKLKALNAIGCAALEAQADRVLRTAAQLLRGESGIRQLVVEFLSSLAEAEEVGDVRSCVSTFNSASRTERRESAGERHQLCYLAVECGRLADLGGRLLTFLLGAEAERLQNLPYLPSLLGVRAREFLTWVVGADGSENVVRVASELLRQL